MNIPMMVVHTTVLLYFLITTILDLYYYLKLEKEVEIIEYLKTLKNYYKFDEIS
jgi:hypothetical protein